MQYFQNLPTINYAPTNLETTASMKNIFYTLELIVKNNNFIKLYFIEGFKRLDTISYELYETTDHWWLLAKLNEINDIIFDLPVHEELLQKVALDRTLSSDGGNFTTINDTGAMSYYINEFESLVIENDNKRQISVIKPAYLSEVITQIVKSL